jgi:GT2 family glycosyltransferase
MAKTSISIIVLVYNGIEDTKELMDDISKLSTKGLDVEMILVDNGSSDGTKKAFEKYKLPNMPFKFIETGANLGYAAGNNIGMKDAFKRKKDYVLLLNNDIYFEKDFLINIVKEGQKDEKVGLLAPKMYFAKGYEYHKDKYKDSDLGKVIWYAGAKIDWSNVYTNHIGVDEVDRGQYDKRSETDVVNGAAVLIRRDLVEDIGYLTEEYFLYWEDADYSVMAKKSGWKVIYTPKAHLWHKVSRGSGIGSKLNDYFLTRNRMVFGIRYAPVRAKLALVRESFKLLLKGRRWQQIGIRDFYLGRLGIGSWGKKDE